MKNVDEVEGVTERLRMFSPDAFGPIATVGSPDVVTENTAATNALDNLVLGLKWAFIYAPGALLLHMVVMTLALLMPGIESPFEMLAQAAGSVLIAAFLIMFGMGKLGELKYLRVVGTIFATSVVFSVISAIAGIFINGNLFTWIFFCSMPLTLLVGYLAKINTDQAPK